MHPTGFVFAIALVVYLAFVVTGRVRLLAAATALLAASWLYYAASFLAQDFSLLEVAKNTNVGADWWLRLSASWAGTGSSLLLLSFFLGVFIFLVHRAGAPLKVARAAAAVLLLLGASAYFYGPFDTLQEATVGGGINPLLKSFWVSIHPPLVFLGYAGVFATSLALAYVEAVGLRRLAYAALAFLFAGLVVGGYWSYVTFGWGGYWAWDPVETAQLMVFVVAAAALHAPKALSDVKKASFLLAAGSVFLALFVTRTGMSPLHGFASPGAGGYLLLALSLAFLLMALRHLLVAKWAVENWGKMLTFLSIFTAGVFLYGSLLVPSLGVAFGLNTAPPQMDDGMWFYNPALYLLVLITLMFSPLIYLERGGKTLLLYVAVGAVASGALAAAAYVGAVPFSPKSHPLTNAAVGAALVWAAMGAGVILYSAYRARGRTSVLRILHLFLLLFFVAAVYSLPHAYSRAYFLDLYVEPGAEAKVAGVSIRVEDYQLGLSADKVDIYTVYRGNSVYQYAQYGLLSAGSLVSQARPFIEEGRRRVEGDPALSYLFALVKKPVHVGDLRIEAGDNVYFVENASVGAYVAHGGAGGLALMLYIWGNSPVNQTMTVEKPLVFKAGDAVVNVTGTLVSSGGALIPMSAVVEVGGVRRAVPMPLDMNLTLYYMTMTPGTPLYGLLQTPYLDLLSDVRAAHTFSDVPKAVPAEAFSKTVLAVDGRRLEAVVRYAINGEVSGIHGLVSAVVTVPRGLDDVYIAVFTPYVQGEFATYPEPMIYYLSQVCKTLNPRESLKLLALAAAGYNINLLSNADPQSFATTFLTALLELATLVHQYTPTQSEIHISVKTVPLVNLLWLSSLAAVILLFYLTRYE